MSHNFSSPESNPPSERRPRLQRKRTMDLLCDPVELGSDDERIDTSEEDIEGDLIKFSDDDNGLLLERTTNPSGYTVMSRDKVDKSVIGHADEKPRRNVDDIYETNPTAFSSNLTSTRSMHLEDVEGRIIANRKVQDSMVSQEDGGDEKQFQHPKLSSADELPTSVGADKCRATYDDEKRNLETKGNRGGQGGLSCLAPIPISSMVRQVGERQAHALDADNGSEENNQEDDGFDSFVTTKTSSDRFVRYSEDTEKPLTAPIPIKGAIPDSRSRVHATLGEDLGSEFEPKSCGSDETVVPYRLVANKVGSFDGIMKSGDRTAARKREICSSPRSNQVVPSIRLEQAIGEVGDSSSIAASLPVPAATDYESSIEIGNIESVSNPRPFSKSKPDFSFDIDKDAMSECDEDIADKAKPTVVMVHNSDKRALGRRRSGSQTNLSSCLTRLPPIRRSLSVDNISRLLDSGIGPARVGGSLTQQRQSPEWMMGPFVQPPRLEKSIGDVTIRLDGKIGPTGKSISTAMHKMVVKTSIQPARMSWSIKPRATVSSSNISECLANTNPSCGTVAEGSTNDQLTQSASITNKADMSIQDRNIVVAFNSVRKFGLDEAASDSKFQAERRKGMFKNGSVSEGCESTRGNIHNSFSRASASGIAHGMSLRERTKSVDLVLCGNPNDQRYSTMVDVREVPQIISILIPNTNERIELPNDRLGMRNTILRVVFYQTKVVFPLTLELSAGHIFIPTLPISYALWSRVFNDRELEGLLSVQKTKLYLKALARTKSVLEEWRLSKNFPPLPEVFKSGHKRVVVDARDDYSSELTQAQELFNARSSKTEGWLRFIFSLEDSTIVDNTSYEMMVESVTGLVKCLFHTPRSSREEIVSVEKAEKAVRAMVVYELGCSLIGLD